MLYIFLQVKVCNSSSLQMIIFLSSRQSSHPQKRKQIKWGDNSELEKDQPESSPHLWDFLDLVLASGGKAYADFLCLCILESERRGEKTRKLGVTPKTEEHSVLFISTKFSIQFNTSQIIPDSIVIKCSLYYTFCYLQFVVSSISIVSLCHSELSHSMLTKASIVLVKTLLY